MRFSFASASSKLPPQVLAELTADIAEWRRSGKSALELPFNGSDFADILSEAEHELRSLLQLPQSYKVLFLQGGASTQFAALPMNLAAEHQPCDYVLSGHWSRRAIEVASDWCDAHAIASERDGFLPDPASWRRSPGAAYCHVTSTETAEGLQYRNYPEPNGSPLIADMTADFLTRPFPIERFGLVYASAQKNLGAAGLTIVIVNENLLSNSKRKVPPPLDYACQASANSKVNTPPTFAIVVALRMLQWLHHEGGLDAAAAKNLAKSKELYAVIDECDFYRCFASPRDRSTISICFRLPDPKLDQLFLDKAEQNGLMHLKGHPNVGGIRACLYNGVTADAASALANFMSDFKRRRG